MIDKHTNCLCKNNEPQRCSQNAKRKPLKTHEEDQQKQALAPTGTAQADELDVLSTNKKKRKTEAPRFGDAKTTKTSCSAVSTSQIPWYYTNNCCCCPSRMKSSPNVQSVVTERNPPKKVEWKNTKQYTHTTEAHRTLQKEQNTSETSERTHVITHELGQPRCIIIIITITPPPDIVLPPGVLDRRQSVRLCARRCAVRASPTVEFLVLAL